jgi:hypothetical protein
MKHLSVLLVLLITALPVYGARDCVNNKSTTVTVTTTSQILPAPLDSDAPTYGVGTVTLAASTDVVWSEALAWPSGVVVGKRFTATQDTTVADELTDAYYITAVPVHITPGSVTKGDVFNAVINGNTATFTATAATVANVTAGLTTAINALRDGRLMDIPVTASDQTTYVQLTHDTAGESFRLTTSSTGGTLAIESHLTLDRAYTGSAGASKTYVIGTPAEVCNVLLYDRQSTDGSATYKLVNGASIPSTTDGMPVEDQTHYNDDKGATGVLLWSTGTTVNSLDVGFFATDIDSP